MGGLQLPTAKSNPMAFFPPARVQTTPLQSSPTSTCGRMNLRRCHSQTLGLELERLSWHEEILLKLVHFHSTFLLQGTTEGEIRWRQVLTNGQTAGDFVLFTACLRWIIGVVSSADPGWRSYTPYDLNKQRLFVCARRWSTEGERGKKMGEAGSRDRVTCALVTPSPWAVD